MFGRRSPPLLSFPLPGGETSPLSSPQHATGYPSGRVHEEELYLPDTYQVTSSISLKADIRKNQLRAEDLLIDIRNEINAIGKFTLGLSFYTLNPATHEDYEKAKQYFHEAEGLWKEDSGKEVFLLFEGNASAKLLDFAEAQKYYKEILRDINPNYIRAKLGLAESTFLQVQYSQKCEELNPLSITPAIELYKDAIRSIDTTQETILLSKANFGLGRAYLC